MQQISLLKKALQLHLLLFIVTRAIYVALAALLHKGLITFFEKSHSAKLHTNYLLDAFAVWDSKWYLQIARNWYPAGEVNYTDTSEFAFFPFYPALIKLLSNLGIDVAFAGILISNTAFFLAVIILLFYAKAFYSKINLNHLLLAVYSFPVAFIYSGVFTESLFFLLAISTWYFFLNKQFAATLVFGVLLGCTRSVGVALAAIMLLDAAFGSTQKKKVVAGIVALGPIIGFLLVAVHNWWLTGDAWVIFHLQKAWNPSYNIPFLAFLTELSNPMVELKFFAAFGLVYLVLFGWTQKQLKWHDLTLHALLIGVPSAMGITSILRFHLSSFPLFIALATYRKWVFKLLVIASILVQLILFIAWVQGTVWVV